jgi:hypothetical protein
MSIIALFEGGNFFALFPPMNFIHIKADMASEFKKWDFRLGYPIADRPWLNGKILREGLD